MTNTTSPFERFSQMFCKNVGGKCSQDVLEWSFGIANGALLNAMLIEMMIICSEILLNVDGLSSCLAFNKMGHIKYSSDCYILVLY